MFLSSRSFVKVGAAAFLSAMMAVSCGSGSGDAFVPSREGMILTSIVYDSSGIATETIRKTVRSVNRTDNNMTVTLISQTIDKNGTVLRTTEETMNVVNGETELKVGGDSGIIRLPSNMNPGYVFADMRSVENIDGMRADVAITNIRLDAIEDITVRAGRFKNAHKMAYDSNVTFRWGGTTVTASTMEWYVKGIGLVKSEAVVYFDGAVMNKRVEELVEIERGSR